MSYPLGQPGIDWSRDMNIRLIEEMKKRRSLWDVDSAEYKDKFKKRNDYDEVASLLSVPSTEIEKRIHNLKSQFRREFRRSRVTTSRNGSVYKSKWYGFRLLKFLKNDDDGAEKLSDRADDVNHERDLYLEACSADTSLPTSAFPHMPMVSEPLQNQFKRSFSDSGSVEEHHRNLRMTKSPGVPQSRDEYTVFGEYVTHELRKIVNQYVLTITKHKIQEALFEAQMSMYTSTDFVPGVWGYQNWHDESIPNGERKSSGSSQNSNSPSSSISNPPTPILS